MKNKSIIWMIILLILFSSMFPITSSYKISSSGDIIYVDDIPGEGPDNPPEDYTIIQMAIRDSSVGDTIFVYNGTYFENLVIEKSINLIGENRESTIINGIGDGIRQKPTININGDFINVSGFTIKESKSYGIDVNSGDNINIYNNIVTSNNYYGIMLYRSDECNISGNVIRNNGLGGIVCHSGLTNSMIFGNNISENVGIGIHLTNSSFNYILKNYIIGNGHSGIAFFNSYRNIISFNTIMSSDIGIEIVRYSIDNTILSNHIEKNDLGISIFMNSVGTSIVKNNILNNECEAYFEIMLIRTLEIKLIYSRRIELMDWDMNYWGDSYSSPHGISGNLYIEYDTLDPYKPPKKVLLMKLIDYDKNPVKEPYDIYSC